MSQRQYKLSGNVVVVVVMGEGVVDVGFVEPKVVEDDSTGTSVVGSSITDETVAVDVP